MQKTVLSTADVARLFSVTETTVKRWADGGMLKCQKTPGGHRKFAIRHVVEFAEDQKFEPVGTIAVDEDDSNKGAMEVAILKRDFESLKSIFIEKSLSPDRTDLFQYLSYLYQHHFQLWEIHDLVLRPGMYEIGERWARGELGINHEHLASQEVLNALAKLQTQILINPPAGRSVVCACMSDELHEIGLRCATYLFESEGWHVHYLGSRTPGHSIVDAVKELKPSLLCLSATGSGSDKPFEEELKELCANAKILGVTVIIGGALARPEFVSEGLCDAVFASSKGLLDYLHRLRAEEAVSTRSESDMPDVKIQRS
jgi:MerR family transcriptional regulator, light-induced transcriptional regulator